jgi:hypothetical protein
MKKFKHFFEFYLFFYVFFGKLKKRNENIMCILRNDSLPILELADLTFMGKKKFKFDSFLNKKSYLNLTRCPLGRFSMLSILILVNPKKHFFNQRHE